MKVRGAGVQLLWLVGALLLRMAPEPLASASYLVLAVYALFGRSQAIHALAMTWLFTMFNPGIAPTAALASLGRYAVLASAAVSVFVRSTEHGKGLRVSRIVFTTWVLGVFLVLHSLFFSTFVDVSVLKAVSWTVGACTLLSAWLGLSSEDRDSLGRGVFGGLVVILLLSLPLLFLSLGFLRNGSGFQGVLNHPQAFGLTIAVLGAWAAGRLVSQESPSWKSVALVGLCLFLIMLSQSRTAGLSMVAGTIVSAIASPMLVGRSARSILPGLWSARVQMLVGFSVVVVLLTGSVVTQRLGIFVTKSSGADSLSGAYQLSRGHLIDDMWLNIVERPLVGIGFGIASRPYEMVIERDPLLRWPTGAAVEKGITVLAVLEEIGIAGLIVAALWVWMMVLRSARGGIAELAVVSTVLFINLGESILFSPGGMGMLMLVLLGWCVSGNRESVRS